MQLQMQSFGKLLISLDIETIQELYIKDTGHGRKNE
jgi:hypothetical protein